MKKSTVGCFICLILALVLAFIITKQKEKENIIILPPNPLALEVKKRHFSEINCLEDNLALQLKTTYNLARLMENWVNLWSVYKNILDSGKIVEPERKERVKDFGQKVLYYIEVFGLDLPEEAKQNLKLENDSKESFNLLFTNIERQLGSQCGSSYRQLYLLAFVQTHAIVCLGDMEAYVGSTEKMVLTTSSVLGTLARELGIYPDLKEKFEKLEKASTESSLNEEVLDEIIEIGDIIFSIILSKFKEEDSRPENQAFFLFSLIFWKIFAKKKYYERS